MFITIANHEEIQVQKENGPKCQRKSFATLQSRESKSPNSLLQDHDKDFTPTHLTARL
jgi:hypothetical protein